MTEQEGDRWRRGQGKREGVMEGEKKKQKKGGGKMKALTFNNLITLMM